MSAAGSGVLCLLGDPEDLDLMWLAVALRDRGHRVEAVLPDEVLTGSRFSCWIDGIDGSGTAWELTLADGRTLDPAQVSLVVNRIASLPAPAAAATDRDALFLAEERRAAVVAWLRLLRCPVLNPPRAASVPGPLLSTPEWRSVAHRLGLPCAPWRSDEPPEPLHVDAVTVGRRVLDPRGILPAGTVPAVVALGQYVGAPLLGLSFDVTGAGPLLRDVDPWPPLAASGDALVDALVDAAGEAG